MLRFFKKYKNLIPIMVLGIVCLFTVGFVLFGGITINGEHYESDFSLQNYLAFLTITFNILIFFKWKKYFKYAVIATIILELFGIINYLFFWTVITFIIPFHGLSLFVMLFYLLLNLGRISAKFKIADEAIDQQKIEKFRDRYVDETDDDLLNIIADQRYTKEAKLAAEEIIQSRKMN